MQILRQLLSFTVRVLLRLSNNMNVNGSTIAMANGVTAEITDGRMFVPFRALGQAFGVSVSWDADTKTAIYNA